jgi:type IV pilus assembly protein PilM
MNTKTIKYIMTRVVNNPAQRLKIRIQRMRRLSGNLLREFLSFGRWEIQNAFVKEITTLDIEENGLRFLVLRGKKINRWGNVPLAVGTIRDGLIIDPEALTAALNDLVATNRIKRGKVNISLSGVQTVHRIVKLPKLPARLLREAIISEAKKEMPVSLDKMYLSWHCLSRKGEEIQRFFLLGVPQNVMDAEVRCLRQAGLAPSFIDIKPIALAKMINRPEALIIDIEPESCTIIVISGGVPQIMRRLAMSTGYSSSERARHVLQEFGRTLQYYETSNSQNPLRPGTPLFITGELASDDDLNQIIKSGSAYQAEVPGTDWRSPPGFVPVQYAVNLGLARRGSGQPAKKARETGRSFLPNLDISPEIYRTERFPAKQIVFAIGIIAGVSLLFPLNQITRDAVEAAGQRQAAGNILSQKVLLRQTQNKEARQIEDAIDSLKPRQQMIADIQREFKILRENRKQCYVSLSHAAVDILPARVDLISIMVEAGKMKLSGQAQGYDRVMGYANALRNTRGFSDVRVLSLKKLNDENETVSFSISLRLE